MNVCRKLSWRFFSRPLPAVPFWFSSINTRSQKTPNTPKFAPPPPRVACLLRGWGAANGGRIACCQASPESLKRILGFNLSFGWHSWEQQEARPQGAPLVTFWKLAVGLGRYCLGGLPRILAANLVWILLCGSLSRSFWCGFWRGIFQNGCPNFGANFGVIFCRRCQTAESRFSKTSN